MFRRQIKDLIPRKGAKDQRSIFPNQRCETRLPSLGTYFMTHFRTFPTDRCLLKSRLCHQSSIRWLCSQTNCSVKGNTSAYQLLPSAYLGAHQPLHIFEFSAVSIRSIQVPFTSKSRYPVNLPRYKRPHDRHHAPPSFFDQPRADAIIFSFRRLHFSC